MTDKEQREKRARQLCGELREIVSKKVKRQGLAIGGEYESQEPTRYGLRWTVTISFYLRLPKPDMEEPPKRRPERKEPR